MVEEKLYDVFNELTKKYIFIFMKYNNDEYLSSFRIKKQLS